ncbi:hypothetical protein TIFTF001_006396 [Ficus carica]|uniref:Uncharacterized protein n=1 Tax=Ficus carica TaxID=3494 RepID=A0AA88CVZ4_FICCA|nr:hypothetical protein TIFTF001_006396 [Ficus carica]
MSNSEIVRREQTIEDTILTSGDSIEHNRLLAGHEEEESEREGSWGSERESRGEGEESEGRRDRSRSV